MQYRSHASVHDFGVICLPAGRRAPASEWYKTGLCLDILSSSDGDPYISRCRPKSLMHDVKVFLMNRVYSNTTNLNMIFRDGESTLKCTPSVLKYMMSLTFHVKFNHSSYIKIMYFIMICFIIKK